LGDVDPYQLDSRTVELLEGRSPHCSTADLRYVNSCFESKQLFVSVVDSAIREQIRARVCAIKTIIPSLRTFQEDTIWLEPCWKILRKLLPPKTKGTLRKELRRSYSRPKNRHLRVQTTESTVDMRSAVDGSGFWFAYRQLFLCSQRYFPYMTEIRPRKGRAKAEGELKDCGILLKSDVCWNRLAKLALELGFSNISIQKLYQEDLAISTNFRSEEASPQLTVDAEEEWRIERRCGRIFEQAFHRDQKYMFLDHIYSNSDPSPRQTITSFAVFRHVFHAFFGKALPSPGSHRDLSPSPAASHSSPDVSASGSEISHHGSTPNEDIDMDYSLSPSQSTHPMDEGESFCPQEEMSSEDITQEPPIEDDKDGNSVMQEEMSSENTPQEPPVEDDKDGNSVMQEEMSSENTTQEPPVEDDKDGNSVMQGASSAPQSPLYGTLDAAIIQPVRVEQVRSADVVAPAAVTSMYGLVESSSTQDTDLTPAPSSGLQSIVNCIPDPENAIVAPVPNPSSQQPEKLLTTYFPRGEEDGNINISSREHRFEEISQLNSSVSAKHPEDSTEEISQLNNSISTKHPEDSTAPIKDPPSFFKHQMARLPSAGLQLSTDSQNMINSSRPEKPLTTYFPAGQPDDLSTTLPASPSVPQSTHTLLTPSGSPSPKLAVAPRDLMNEGSEEGSIADSLPQAQDPHKHMTTLFPGGKRKLIPKSPQFTETNSQFPAHRPDDDQQSSVSKSRKRKSWSPITTPILSNSGTIAVKYHTSVEQILRLLEQLRTNPSTRNQLPYCLVDVSNLEYTWWFSNHIHDARIVERRFRRMTEQGKFFTFGDLVRRQFSTINTIQATQYFRRRIPVFEHHVEINFRTAFPPIEESDRTFHPTIPRWDAKLGEWTSFEIPFSSSKKPRKFEPVLATQCVNATTPPFFATTVGELESTSEEEDLIE
jgi:Protein of unknown function (DUF3723)